jgi:peptide/nickel transport system substrate-binding protein
VKKGIFLIALAGILMLAIACAPTAAVPTSAPPTSAPAATTAVEATAAPAATAGAEPTTASAAAKDTLVIAQTVDPPNLDPFNTTAPYISVFAQICEPLMYWDSDAEGNAVIKPRLATEWNWVDDTTLEFKLREGVTFSNGEPFNAEAAKLSLEQLFAAFNYSQWLADLLDEVQVVDDNTVRVVLTKPAGYLTSVLAMGSFQIAPKDFTDRGAEVFNQSPVCTGPWTLKEHVKDSHITLAANPNYWGGAPKFNEITYRIIPDDAARVAALEAGEIDIAPNIPHSAADRIAGNDSLELLSIPSLRQFATHFDVDNPKAEPLKDARVRLALNLAIDRETMCAQLFNGRCTPMQGQFLSKFHSGFNPDLQTYPYDPERAKQLLAEAGYPDGFEVDYTYTTGRYPLDKQAGEAMAAYLRAIGLTVNESAVDFPEWARQFDASPRETTALYTVGFLFAQDGYLANLSYTPGKRFRTSVMPEGFDTAMEQAGVVADEAERIKLIQQAEAATNEEPFAVYLSSIEAWSGVQDWVAGFVPRPDQTLRLTDMGVTPK